MALIEKTLFGTIDKVALAIEFLQKHEPSEGYYLAYSGGKDSTVILDLARKAKVKFDAHYNVTTVDPPELIYFIREQEGIIWEYPEINMWDLIVYRRMPPTKIVRYCCAVFKEPGGLGRKVITGVRRAESSRRSDRQPIEVYRKNPSKQFYHPILYWTETDVWEYIYTRNLPYCSLYDEGFKRLGCVCCPMGNIKNRLQEAERWPKFKDAYIRAFQRMVDKKKEDGYDTRGWDTGQDVWDWWLNPYQSMRENTPKTLFD